MLAHSPGGWQAKHAARSWLRIPVRRMASGMAKMAMTRRAESKIGPGPGARQHPAERCGAGLGREGSGGLLLEQDLLVSTGGSN